MTTVCVKCGHLRDRHNCAECARRRSAAWDKANPDRKRENNRRFRENNRDKDRQYRLKWQFHITPERFDEIFERQGSACGICGSLETAGNGWHIDHDHACCPAKRSCGKCIRGILCAHCNIGLGSFRDDPARLRSAADYLQSYDSGEGVTP